jgi:hypothetical protein
MLNTRKTKPMIFYTRYYQHEQFSTPKLFITHFSRNLYTLRIIIVIQTIVYEVYQLLFLHPDFNFNRHFAVPPLHTHLHLFCTLTKWSSPNTSLISSRRKDTFAPFQYLRQRMVPCHSLHTLGPLANSGNYMYHIT